VERGAVVELRGGLSWEIDLDMGIEEGERTASGREELKQDNREKRTRWLVAGDWRVRDGL
jgi:hypothetical protein